MKVDDIMAGRPLSGMKAICAYMQRSESSVLRLIRDYDFPAKKLMGVWETHTLLIERWRIRLLADESQNNS